MPEEVERMTAIASTAVHAAQGKDFDCTELDKLKAVSCGISGG